ncbi:MAG: type I-B CRISPR-associated protein Cas5b [Oscillospiraceae bacterium]
MIRAVRISGRQQMPNYRKPISVIVKETFPLPPYSSVIGLVHTLCGWTGENGGYRPMRVSVQGMSAGTVNDYATNYSFGNKKYEAGRHTLAVPNGGDFLGVSRGPKSYELLSDVRLTLHIIPQEDFLIEEIAQAFKDPPIYPSLGRYEDLLQIESVDIVELKEADEDDELVNKMDAYLPLALSYDDASNLMGTVYRLNKVFEYSPKNKMRVWKETVYARHITKGVFLQAKEGIYLDSCFGDVVLPI